MLGTVIFAPGLGKETERQKVMVVPTVVEVSRGTTPKAKTLTVQATAYSHTGSRTYTGTWPREGRTIAVDTNTIPLGSRVYIKGIGWRVAEDKIPPGSVAKGARVDLFMEQEDDCWRWGRRDVEVVVEAKGGR